jgi:hypothetical protein
MQSSPQPALDEPLSLFIAAGAEIVCTSGQVRLTATGPWLEQAWAPAPRLLPAGQAWRATQAQWVKLEGALQPARFRLTAPGHAGST